MLEFAMILSGVAGLSMAMRRHQKQMRPRKFLSTQQVVLLRVVGFASLIFGVLLCIIDHGIGPGLAVWAGLFTAAATLQTVLLTYRPGWVIPFTSVLLLGTVLLTQLLPA